MKKNIPLAGFIFIFLLQSPLVLAIGCKSVSDTNYNVCMDILSSGITDAEKELLISNLDYQNKSFPDHEYIFNKNSNMEMGNVPENVIVYNKEFIKNAWADIFALMPSILYNGSLYVPEKTSIFTAYNYELELPENYFSSGYPQTKNGDCKTKYSLVENNAENRVYVNGQYKGNGDFVDLDINKDSEIKSEYNVDIELEIMHYEWDRYCSSRRKDGSCRRYSYSCDYDSTESKKDSLKIADSVNVKFYKNNLFAYIEPINSYESTTKLGLNYSDSIKVSFKDSEYDFDKYIYSIDYSKPPYYVSTLKAEEYNQEKTINLFKEGNALLIKNTQDCKIKAFDFFNILEKDCNSDSQNIDFFIKTDKLKYKKGEEIQVSIFPSNVSAKISYGNEVKFAQGKAKFTAEDYLNKIVAEYNGLKSEKIIYITDKAKLVIIWNLVVFTFLNYFIYIILRRYSEKIKWQKNADY